MPWALDRFDLLHQRCFLFSNELRTSPGNGHDLACTSGLAVASAIGAEYPLKDEEARRDARQC